MPLLWHLSCILYQVEIRVLLQETSSSFSSALEFDEYFNNLIPSKNTRNPWFREYWEETYQCKFAETPLTRFNQNYTRECSGPFVLLRAKTSIHSRLELSRYR